MKQTVLRYGLYGMGTAFALFLSGLWMGKDLDFSSQEYIGYTALLISLAYIFFGVRHFRDRVNNGRISFRRAVLLGLLIASLTGIGVALADFIYTSLINPDFFEEYKTVMRDEGYKGEIPDYGSGFLALIMFMTVMVMGLVVSLVTGLILQQK